MRLTGCALAAGMVFLSSVATSDALAAPSRLWGDTGELWDPHGRLPDFSYAGYRAGREPIPELPVATNVLDFGAVGDGVTDDTAAFLAAIEATNDGALLVPAGRYLVRDVLTIDRDGVVIRGAGPDATVIYIDRSLTDVNGGVQDPNFSWSGGFLVLHRSTPPTPVGPVTAPALRGDRWLELETVEGIDEQSLVMVSLVDDAAGSLGRHMHNEQEDAERCSGDPVVFNWRARVAHVDAATSRIELDNPLPVDVRAEWAPKVQVLHYLTGSGIEGLTIEFPVTTTPPHIEERGYNGIQLSQTVDSWVRDVEIRNPDSGIFVSGAHNTIADVRFVSERPANAAGNQGHHGVGSGQSCLLTRLTFDAEFTHSVTVSNQAARNVFSELGGSSVVRLDHHRRTPIENLFTAFDSPWDYRSGGSGCEGPHSGARSTYWGLPGPVQPPCNAGGSGQCWGHIQANVVGELAMAEQLTDDREWYENVADLGPHDLHLAQLERRLAIEDRDARFSPLRFGLRSDWEENDHFRWAVVEDGGDDRYFLATTMHQQKEGDRLGEYAVADTPPLGDATITARARTNEQSDNNYPDIALVLGYQDDSNYEYAMFNGEAVSSAIFAVRDGQRVELANAQQAIITDDAWHEIGFRRTDDLLEMLWDGQVIASTEGVAGVPAPIAGRVGVGAYNDSVWFDDIEIESPDLPELPPDPSDSGGSDDAGDDSGGGDDGEGGSSDGPSVTGSTTDADTDTAGQRDDAGGCGCRTAGSRPWLAAQVSVLFGLAFFRRRRHGARAR